MQPYPPFWTRGLGGMGFHSYATVCLWVCPGVAHPPFPQLCWACPAVARSSLCFPAFPSFPLCTPGCTCHLFSCTDRFQTFSAPIHIFLVNLPFSRSKSLPLFSVQWVFSTVSSCPSPVLRWVGKGAKPLQRIMGNSLGSGLRPVGKFRRRQMLEWPLARYPSSLPILNSLLGPFRP